MIVPRNRLLLWVAIIVLPFALLWAVQPAALTLSLLVMFLLLVIAALDATLAAHGLDGIVVELPAVARMSKDREASVQVRIGNKSQKAKAVRFGLPLPIQIQSAYEDQTIALPEGSEWSQFTWSCRPLERGTFQMASAYLEIASPLGFWAFRRRVPTACEIRVYPNLISERRNLAALFLHRGSFGLHAQRQVGKGRDFEKLREYSPGDSFDEIHWKATARRGKPITKVFQIERTQEIYVIVDASRLSARRVSSSRSQVQSSQGSTLQVATGDSQPSTVLERFITAALVLGLAAEQQGDLFGLVTFTDKVERFIRARNGKAHYSGCRDALYTLQPKVVTPDFDELCTFIRLRMRRRALLFFLTSLDDAVVADSFLRNMDLLRRQHLVMVNMLQPPGVAPVFSDPNIISLDQLYEHLGGHLLWQKLRELEKVLQRRGVRFSLLKNERLSAELVAQYLGVKQRQLL